MDLKNSLKKYIKSNKSKFDNGNKSGVYKMNLDLVLKFTLGDVSKSVPMSIEGVSLTENFIFN